MSYEDDYKSKLDSRRRSITQELLLTNVEILKKLQETFEAGLRDKMYSLSVSDTQGMREVHATLKGSRSFISWIETQKNKLEG